MRDFPNWRYACVVRARTIAANLRLIEFAVEGGLPPFGGDVRTRVRPLKAGPVTAGSYVCVNVGEGRLRVLVGAADGDGAARFMWSLIEGARVRLTVPAAASVSRAAAAVRIGDCAGVRLCVAAGDMEPSVRPRWAANGNAASRQHFSF